MKTRIIICLTSLILFNSCIVNSLFPFYTKDTISFEETFLGIWGGGKEGKEHQWSIISIKDGHNFVKERDTTTISKKDLAFYNKYKLGYWAVYKEKENLSFFIVMPFKINNQLFLDFIPSNFGDDNLNSKHLVPTHSLAKFDILDDDTINISWLSSKKIAKLIKENKIKINHQKVGANDDEYLLTASSEELQKFIKKYMTSNDEHKWKTDVKFNLKRTHSKEKSLEVLKVELMELGGIFN